MHTFDDLTNEWPAQVICTCLGCMRTLSTGLPAAWDEAKEEVVSYKSKGFHLLMDHMAAMTVIKCRTAVAAISTNPKLELVLHL